jgi:lipopolysaccharide biosynthesis glycosyltransferase
MRMETVNIAFVFDDKFSDLFTVAAYSAAKNASTDLAIYAVDCGISEENLKKISKLPEKCGKIKSIEFAAAERMRIFEEFPVNQYFSSAIFYRLTVPNLFPKLDRVIYLDCDVVVDGDIAKLWNENLYDRALGVVDERNFYKISADKKKVGFTEETCYFNSGVLLIDCKKFNELKILERTIKCISNSKFPLQLPDQDAMNMCLSEDDYSLLSPKYNFIPLSILFEKTPKTFENPIILHYTVAKPYYFSERFLKFLCATEFFRTNFAYMMMKFWKYADEILPNENFKSNFKFSLKFFLLASLFRMKNRIGNFFYSIIRCKKIAAFFSVNSVKKRLDFDIIDRIEQCEKK